MTYPTPSFLYSASLKPFQILIINVGNSNHQQKKGTKMKRETTILNTETVAKMVKENEDRIASLNAPVTDEDIRNFIKEESDWDLNKVMPKGTCIGRVEHSVKGGVTQKYGFVRTSTGDIFVSPKLMTFDDGERVAVLPSQGERGLFADKITTLEKYISWHEEEIFAAIREAITAHRKEEAEYFAIIDPASDWNRMVEACKTLGFTLTEVQQNVDSRNYGGRGEDVYLFAEPVTPEQAEEILTAVKGRHAEPDNGCPYDHGHDRVHMLGDTAKHGFRNCWCGHWND